MLRYWLPITTLTLLAACGTSHEPPAYPRTVGGGYRLDRETVLAGEQIPGIPPSGMIRAVQLVYDASNPIQLTVVETKGWAVAFEAMQKWRAQEGSRAAQMDRYFVIAQSEKPDPVALQAFLTDFEQQLK